MLNHIIIHGRLTADPKLKKTQSNVEFCKVTVAVDRFGTSEEKLTDFFNVTFWRNNAKNICNFFKKGQEIIINGSMQMNNYKDSDGNNRVFWELNAFNFDFCGNKVNSQGNTENAENQQINAKDQQVFSVIDDSDGDLPF